MGIERVITIDLTQIHHLLDHRPGLLQRRYLPLSGANCRHLWREIIASPTKNIYDHLHHL